MGTNYYLHRNVCEHCGRSDDRVHIGKSSMGWVFALHVYPEDGIHDLHDWEREWQSGIIKDELGKRITAAEMRARITKRSSAKDWWDKSELDYANEESFHRLNGSMRGPNGLLRDKTADSHGAGTWDCFVGDFS